MEQGQENRRPDILLFVNGIPVCIIELKNPTKANATVRDAPAVCRVRSSILRKSKSLFVLPN